MEKGEGKIQFYYRLAGLVAVVVNVEKESLSLMIFHRMISPHVS